MKNIIKTTMVLFTLFINVNAKAQENATLDNALLWEISGKGLDKPSFLYGTVHMICADDFFVSEKTKNALAAADELVLEINLSDSIEMAAAQNSLMGKELLSKQLGKEDVAKLDDILKRTAGMNISQVDNYTMSFVMSLISMKTFGCTDLKFYEMNFIETAKQQQKEITGLETIKFQFEMLSKAYTDSEMINMLATMGENETQILVDIYKQENIEKLYTITTDKKIMDDKSKKLMLDDRNVNWAKKLPVMMQDKSVFVAVGAAHLAGENGVIHLLRKAGYTVKSIAK